MGYRQAFLQTVRAELDCLPAPLIADILDDLDAHFREALAAGRTEAQAASRLGDPAMLGCELRWATAAAARGGTPPRPRVQA